MQDLNKLNTVSPIAFGAIGDAYGFCFEFASQEFVLTNNNLEYHQHPEFSVRPGVYSDDTQMQMALAEIIASEREWSAHEIASAFISVYKRDPRQGYARRFSQFLDNTNDAFSFLQNINPDSERNGAAMRAPVIGLFPELSDVVVKSEIQAKITHDTRSAVDSAIASALLCHYFAYDLGPAAELPDFLKHCLPAYNWQPDWKGHVPVHGISTVQAAITAIMKTSSLAELLKTCVSFTGDVDSVATIALAAASSSYQFKRDIPFALIKDFEHGNFGMDYLLELDSKVRQVTIEAFSK